MISTGAFSRNCRFKPVRPFNLVENWLVGLLKLEEEEKMEIPKMLSVFLHLEFR